MKTRPQIFQCCFLAFLLAGMSQLHAASFVDFNTVGDMGGKFFGAVSSGTVAENYAEAAGIGISGSRALDTTGTSNNYTTLIFNQESFSLANIGDSVTVSAFALRRADVNPGNVSSSFLRIGLTDGSTNDNNRLTGGNGNAIALDVYSNIPTTSDFTDVIFRYSNKVSTVSFATVAGGTSTLTTGNWYKLTGTFTNVGSGNLSISGTLDDYGTAGTTYQSTVRTISSSNFANSGLIADTTLFAAVLARQDGGSDALDNFAVTSVPEPTSLALLGAGALGLLLRRRR